MLMPTESIDIQTELQQIEEPSAPATSNAVSLRWQSGQHLLTLRGAEQFPRGPRLRWPRLSASIVRN